MEDMTNMGGAKGLSLIAETTRAIAANPEDAEAYRTRARVLFAMRQIELAGADLDVLIDKLHEESAELFEMRGAIRMRGGDKDGAEADFRRAIELDPNLLSRMSGTYRG